MTDSLNGDYGDDVVCLDDKDFNRIAGNHDDDGGDDDDNNHHHHRQHHLHHHLDDDDDLLDGDDVADDEEETEEYGEETTADIRGLDGQAGSRDASVKLSEKATEYLHGLQTERMHIDQAKCPITERLLDAGG